MLPDAQSPAMRPMPADGLPVPGVGMAGQVMCPFMSVVRMQPCLKGGCELWTELTYAQGTPQEHRVGRCALSWLAVLSTETREAIDRVKEGVVHHLPHREEHPA